MLADMGEWIGLLAMLGVGGVIFGVLLTGIVGLAMFLIGNPDKDRGGS